MRYGRLLLDLFYYISFVVVNRRDVSQELFFELAKKRRENLNRGQQMWAREKKKETCSFVLHRH
jgi:hypothetical protein